MWCLVTTLKLKKDFFHNHFKTETNHIRCTVLTRNQVCRCYYFSASHKRDECVLCSFFRSILASFATYLSMFFLRSTFYTHCFVVDGDAFYVLLPIRQFRQIFPHSFAHFLGVSRKNFEMFIYMQFLSNANNFFDQVCMF